MSRTTTRVAAGALLGLAVTGSTLIAAPAAFAAPAAPVVAPGSVAAEQVFTVSGTDCPEGVPGNPNLIMVGIDDGSPELLQNGDFAAADGTWSLELAFKAGTTPGTYEVHAACVDYLGFYEVSPTYTTNVEYPVATVTLVDPNAEPTTPTTSTPAPSTTPAPTAAFVPGAKPNTPGIATTTTSATTDSTPAPGEKVVRVIKGFQPYEQVSLVLHSTPTPIGTFPADAQGVLTVEFTLPAGVPAGTHTLAFDGNMGSHFEETVTVVAAGATVATASESLAYTGADVTVPLVAGTGLVLLGGATVFAARRRKAAAQG
ncbi:LPXTG cell wall anchor domain-containing protein [Geodermatophilus sp. SYSU D00705]